MNIKIFRKSWSFYQHNSKKNKINLISDYFNKIQFHILSIRLQSTGLFSWIHLIACSNLCHVSWLPEIKTFHFFQNLFRLVPQFMLFMYHCDEKARLRLFLGYIIESIEVFPPNFSWLLSQKSRSSSGKEVNEN